MSNAKLYDPQPGAFTLAAKRLGYTKQYVGQCWKTGKPMRVVLEVISASKEIKTRKERERRQYSEMLRKAAQLADEVNGLAE